MRVLAVPLLGAALVLTACGDEDPPRPGQAADGPTVYRQICALCHGSRGEGSIGPGLTAQVDVDAVATQTRNGNTEAGMPAYGGELSDAEIEAVARYVVEQLGGS